MASEGTPEFILTGFKVPTLQPLVEGELPRNITSHCFVSSLPWHKGARFSRPMEYFEPPGSPRLPHRNRRVHSSDHEFN